MPEGHLLHRLARNQQELVGGGAAVGAGDCPARPGERLRTRFSRTGGANVLADLARTSDKTFPTVGSAATCRAASRAASAVSEAGTPLP
ncbi:MAG: hypothetical protein KY438_07560 [Actinobacteria bacterium]|nr:hypothetical protein [Actinomycetota bacterium]